MNDDIVDLSSLDVTHDQLRMERLMREINRAAAPELERRALQSAPLSTLAEVWRWRRMLVAASALVSLVGGSAWLLGPQTNRPAGFSPASAEVAVALGVPNELLPYFETELPQ
ncbi:MAG: hypothetical protein IPF87_18215 [Gemmatimonadetes bacterium]|nr:hypothetical protein [Gemmatimonadota bacterium]